MKIDVIILNYNGKDLLKAYLPSVCDAVKKSSHDCKLHVLDNLSSDNSAEFLKSNYMEVDFYTASENKILCSYNDMVKELDSDIVIFLNNDIKVESDFVDYLIEHFKEDNVMFVAPRIMNFDGTYNGGRSYLEFDKGVIKVLVDKDRYMEPGETCSISCGAFRRNAFLKFGGFDDLYLPGIWEDVDLCFNGLLGGWKGIYEPRSIIWHKESTTFHREYGERKKIVLAHRNMFLFFWKNIFSKKLFLKHLLFLPLRILYSILTGKTEFAYGFLEALKKLPDVSGKRNIKKRQIGSRKLKESEIIA